MRITVSVQLDPSEAAAVALADAPALVLAALGGDAAADECHVQAQRPDVAALGAEPPIVNYPGIQITAQVVLGPDDHAAWSANDGARRVLQALGGKPRADSCALSFQSEPGLAGTPPLPPAAPPAR